MTDQTRYPANGQAPPDHYVAPPQTPPPTGPTLSLPAGWQVILTLLGMGVLGTGGSYLGAQQAEQPAVVSHRLSQVESSVGELAKKIDSMQEGLRTAGADRWTKGDHEAYAEGVRGRHEATREKLADVERRVTRLEYDEARREERE